MRRPADHLISSEVVSVWKARLSEKTFLKERVAIPFFKAMNLRVAKVPVPVKFPSALMPIKF